VTGIGVKRSRASAKRPSGGPADRSHARRRCLRTAATLHAIAPALQSAISASRTRARPPVSTVGCSSRLQARFVTPALASGGRKPRCRGQDANAPVGVGAEMPAGSAACALISIRSCSSLVQTREGVTASPPNSGRGSQLLSLISSRPWAPPRTTALLSPTSPSSRSSWRRGRRQHLPSAALRTKPASVSAARLLGAGSSHAAALRMRGRGCPRAVARGGKSASLMVAASLQDRQSPPKRLLGACGRLRLRRRLNRASFPRNARAAGCHRREPERG